MHRLFIRLERYLDNHATVLAGLGDQFRHLSGL